MNVVKTVRDQIEEGILTVRYAPGERLDEMRLAEEYGVSRTPIREALKQLSENGLIEIRHRRGAIVTNPQPHQILEKFEVMSELEGAAGARAAQRFTTDDKLALLAAHEACANSASTEDTDRYYYDNEQFHKVIYAASHCGFLAEQCLMLHKRLRPYRRLQLRVHNRMRTSIQEHTEIVDAILAGDASAARELLRNHVAIQGDRFNDLMSSIASAFSRKE
ncbi:MULTISPECIES: GntR family transcriptional regulator [unclassified Ochrobactrum]|uniref:GntR family transcriptional regulator n=1 Tax=unclassified Ochrobactrum TaxID=239106 RepID=UPI000DEECC3B|nr:MULTISPECIES: GntR family transcriptional regulator [unclassified Ochrobactrum]MBQ0710256.1 GntR family transcriptional regulator [Ochrobactrum sp. AP1BH01-1]